LGAPALAFKSAFGLHAEAPSSNLKARPGVRSPPPPARFDAIEMRGLKMTTRKEGASTPAPTAEDPRWTRIVARDSTADGQFWFSVATTGVYCRPSCPSRQAKPENVTLHDTLAAAKATGFRPCKRCNPDGVSVKAENAQRIARACRQIELSEGPLS